MGCVTQSVIFCVLSELLPFISDCFFFVFASRSNSSLILATSTFVLRLSSSISFFENTILFKILQRFYMSSLQSVINTSVDGVKCDFTPGSLHVTDLAIFTVLNNVCVCQWPPVLRVAGKL